MYEKLLYANVVSFCRRYIVIFESWESQRPLSRILVRCFHKLVRRKPEQLQIDVAPCKFVSRICLGVFLQYALVWDMDEKRKDVVADALYSVHVHGTDTQNEMNQNYSMRGI